MGHSEKKLAATRTWLVRPSQRREEEFIQAVNRSRSLHKNRVVPPDTSAKYQAYLKAVRRKNQESFFILTRDSCKLAGVVNISGIMHGYFKSAYLGYYAFLPHAGSGLMKEGLVQVVGFAFATLKLHRLEANIMPENKRSRGLVASLGFRLEGYSPRYLKVCGRWRDHERWAILADEWKIK